jgi:hypothetical protein
MKKFVERTLTSLFLAALAFGYTAHAQHAEHVMKASIPFEFSVGDQTFPAGQYSLVNAAPMLLELRDADNRCLTRVRTNSVLSSKTPTSSKLQFYSEGGQAALARVWQKDYPIGQELRLPKSWTKTAKRNTSHTQAVAESSSE